MRNIFKRIISLSLSLCMIFVLCACSAWRWVPYYISCDVENIPDKYTEDFFVSDNFEFTRVNGVVFQPYLRFGGGTGDGFSLGLTVYSKTGKEKVLIKNAYVEDDGMKSANFEINEEALFEVNEYMVYEWYLSAWRGIGNSIFFSDEDIKMVNGNVFHVIVTVEVTSGDSTVETSLRYEVEVFVQSGPAWLHV